VDSYIRDIIQALTKLTGLTPHNATELFEYYRPAFEAINDRYWTPEDWAEIIVDNLQSGITVDKWVEHVKWCNTIPIWEDE
jgi:hypothetical protein